MPPLATGIAPEMEIVGFPATPLPFATAIGEVPMIVRSAYVPAPVRTRTPVPARAEMDVRSASRGCPPRLLSAPPAVEEPVPPFAIGRIPFTSAVARSTAFVAEPVPMN